MTKVSRLSQTGWDMVTRLVCKTQLAHQGMSMWVKCSSEISSPRSLSCLFPQFPESKSLQTALLKSVAAHFERKQFFAHSPHHLHYSRLLCQGTQVTHNVPSPPLKHIETHRKWLYCLSINLLQCPIIDDFPKEWLSWIEINVITVDVHVFLGVFFYRSSVAPHCVSLVWYHQPTGAARQLWTSPCTTSSSPAWPSSSSHSTLETCLLPATSLLWSVYM